MALDSLLHQFEDLKFTVEEQDVVFANATTVAIREDDPRLMSESLGRSLGACIGSVVCTDTRIIDGNMGEFLRVWISIDVSKPLRRCVALGGCGSKPRLCPLQYEKLPNFCHGVDMKARQAIPVQQKGRIHFHEEAGSSNSHSGFSSLGDNHEQVRGLVSLLIPASVASPLGVATATSLNAKEGVATATSLNAKEGVAVSTEATVGVDGSHDVLAVDGSGKVHITDNILFGVEHDVFVTRVSHEAAAPVVVAPAFDAIEEWLAEDNDSDVQVIADLLVKIPAKRSLDGSDPSKAKRARSITTSSVSKESRVLKAGMSSSKISSAAAHSSECISLIQTTWASTSATLLDKFTAIAEHLKTWQGEHRAKTVLRIRFLQHLLDTSLQRPPSHIPNHHLVNAKLELECLLRANEIYWAQRSHVQWLANSDKNTHTTSVLNIAVAFFSGLFTSSSFENLEILNHILPTVTFDMNASLLRPFTADEVVTTFRDIGPGKAPGIDGFPSSFFRLHWNTIGSDFTQLCLDLLHGSADMASINHTIIVLIPKVASPDYMRQFRPIRAFISGRSIADNILIAHELIHSLSSIGTAPYQGAAVKLDIEKAFDRVKWNFLRDVMLRLGFDSTWVSLILHCIKTISFTVRINGCFSQEFRPQRGLRQGDPLSIFLFLICTQTLFALLTAEQYSSDLVGLCASRNGPRINHLLFADDSLIFIRNSANEALRLKHVLHIYGQASGQRVNYDKSTIFFCPKIGQQDRDAIFATLGLHEFTDPGVYLGNLGVWVSVTYISFNIAILGKHIWWLISAPDSLFARVFRDRYFPSGNISDATCNMRASFAWKGLFVPSNLYSQVSCGDLELIAMFVFTMSVGAVTFRSNFMLLHPSANFAGILPEGFVKINTDGAFNQSTHEAGIGVIARNSTGEVLGGFAQHSGISIDALHTEFLAVVAGIQFAREKDWRDVHIETDSTIVVNKFNRVGPDLSVLGRQVERYRLLLGEFNVCLIHFAPKSCNSVAHTLARHACSSGLSFFFGSDCPVLIRSNVLVDLHS
ncbi:hypothetical protein GQ457_17G013650 [Hibiscus cannabinus]